ncbi:MAG: peptidoglycan DD-metalloendopeptidase family protein [Gammaproteobacteria bacterium]|nr:MAG: peptidoglycan DD-metalloendopeptidase family protein [Gammaproteobacteria bacterium]
MRTRTLISTGLATWLALGWLTALAGESLTQAEAESRLKRLRTEIGSLKKDLESNRKAYSEEQKLLRAADLEIQASVLTLRKLDATRRGHEQALAGLYGERQDYLDSLEQRKEALATQIMAAYRLGRESRLKLVLNQDSPAKFSRTLAYYDYFSRSQALQIQELRQVLQTLDLMRAKINAELSALDVVQRNQQATLDEVKNQRGDREVVVVRLSSQIGSDEARLMELQQNIRALEVLLEKLPNVLADIPADLGKRLGLKDQKGKLPLPVKGRVKHAYGKPRSAGLNWQGWLIAAATGSEVNSIAYGRVAFSDWLRGYGLLLIIDHGDGFMSLYGNNESLLHEVGDWVEPGIAISTVGSSPQSGAGLYFEIRKNGKALDPAAWLNR